MSTEKIDDFLTVKTLSEYIKLSPSHIYALVNKKIIPFKKIGTNLLFERETIDKWLVLRKKNNKKVLHEFLTVKKLSLWIKLSESHIYALVNKKKIPYIKLGGKVLFDTEKIKNWIDEQSN